MLGLTGIMSSFKGFVALTAFMFAYKLFVATEAYRSSKKLNPYTLKNINKVWIYILFGVVGYGVTWAGVYLNRSIIGYDFHEIPTPSMLPTIEPGDRIVAISMTAEKLSLGDIVTFKREDGQTYLSRIVGLGNETISIANDRVIYESGEEQLTALGTSSDGLAEFRNFKAELSNKKKYSVCKIETYQGREFPQLKISNIEKLEVPEGHVYVVSDNRNNGLDSRTYGTIPIENIDKVVRYIWWSDDLNRVGMSLSE